MGLKLKLAAVSPMMICPCTWVAYQKKAMLLYYTPGQKFCPQIGGAVTSPNSAISTVHQLSDPLQSLKLTLSAFQCALHCEIWCSSVSGYLEMQSCFASEIATCWKILPLHKWHSIREPGKLQIECVNTSLWSQLRVQGCFVGPKLST